MGSRGGELTSFDPEQEATGSYPQAAYTFDLKPPTPRRVAKGIYAPGLHDSWLHLGW